MPGVAGISNDPLAVDDEGARQLEGVADHLLDVMALARRLEATDDRSRTDHLPQRTALQPKALVALSLRVRQAWERRLEAIAQGLRLLRVSLRHRQDAATCLPDLLVALPERLQVLPAERSAEVSEEGDDDGPVVPELSERDLAPVASAESNVGSRLADV